MTDTPLSSRPTAWLLSRRTEVEGLISSFEHAVNDIAHKTEFHLSVLIEREPNETVKNAFLSAKGEHIPSMILCMVNHRIEALRDELYEIVNEIIQRSDDDADQGIIERTAHAMRRAG